MDRKGGLKKILIQKYSCGFLGSVAVSYNLFTDLLDFNKCNTKLLYLF